MQQQQGPPNPFLRALNEAAERRRQDANSNNANKTQPPFPPFPSASGSGSETQQGPSVNVNHHLGPDPDRGRGRGGVGRAPRGLYQPWRNNPSAAGPPSPSYQSRGQGRPYRQAPIPNPISISLPSTPYNTSSQPDGPRASSPVSRAMEHARSVLQRRPPPPHIQQPLEGHRQFLQRTQEPQGFEVLRRETLRRINMFVNNKFGNEFCVELFGSGHYGVSAPSSDLDLVIVDRNRMTGFCPRESRGDWLPPIYNIRRLGKDLWGAGYKNVQAIPSANVPIVKFLDPVTGMECDINVNDQLGLINSRMLKIYCDMSPVLRPMLFAVKAWAKPLGLNNPSGMGPRTFSSYALALMTIGFLQMRGLLPNLQAGLEPLDPKCEDEGSIFWVRQKQKRIKCDIRYDSRSVEHAPVQNDIELLMTDWFKYWGGEFDYAEMMVVIREGGIVRRPLPMQKKREKGKKEKGKKEKGKASVEEIQQSEQEQEEGRGEGLTAADRNEVGEVEEAEDVEVIDITDAGDASELDSIAPDGSSANPLQSTQDASQLQVPNEGADVVNAAAEGNVVTQLPADDDDWQRHQFVVVDPFIHNKNVVRGADQRVPMFIEACRDAVRELNGGKTVNEMIAGLVPVVFPPAPPRKKKFKNKGKKDKTKGEGKGDGDETARKVESR
ncbi:hypothetical protein EYR40_001870 [Pleurotus pulmonarius]|nr:hypothetical protein EYR40_001870 [Pleurotus pulmonarius]